MTLQAKTQMGGKRFALSQGDSALTHANQIVETSIPAPCVDEVRATRPALINHHDEQERSPFGSG